MSQTVPAHRPPDPAAGPLPVASWADTWRVLAGAVMPIVAQGAILRRRRVVALAGRLRTDDRGVRILQRMRERYGPGPLRVRVPGRSIAVVLDRPDVARVLSETPEPFAPANREKRGALGHFQPHAVLISSGEARADRRRFNESVLDSGTPVHSQAAAMVRAAREEAALVRAAADASGRLDWDTLFVGWWRVVRRIVLGDGARDDAELTDMLETLRSAGNWAYLRPHGGTRALRERFDTRLRAHVDRAEPGSLVAMFAAAPGSAVTDPAGQVPHWLFAYDAAGAANMRALALLAAHPEEAGRVRAETGAGDPSGPRELPRLRAAVLEALRLWPTTPLLLRDSTVETRWAGAPLPAGSSLLIPTWFFHRDDRSRPDADRFAPDQWLDAGGREHRAVEDWSSMPFSGGPGTCPARELVLFTTSTFLAAVLDGRAHRVDPSVLHGSRPLPRGLDPFTLSLAVSPSSPV